MRISRTELETMKWWLTESEKEMEELRKRVKSLAELTIRLEKSGDKKNAERFKDIEGGRIKRMFELKQTQNKAREMILYYGQHQELIDE